MRPVKRKPTQRGIGTIDDPRAEASPTTPPVQVPDQTAVAVSFRPPIVRPATQYSSLRPAPRETLAMKAASSDELPPSSRRGTSRMPACVEEIGGATAAVATGRARHAIVKRLPWGKRVNEPVTAVEMRLLAAVDGALSLRSLVDVSGMPESDVLTVIDRLVRLRIVTIE